MTDPVYVGMGWMARRLRMGQKELKKYLKSRRIKPDLKVRNSQPSYKHSKMIEYIPELAGRI